MKKKVTYETWPLSRLKSHPRQADNFDPISPTELQALKEVMKKGRYDPVEVTPQRVIIDGHQRLRAAIALGWTEIRVKIRHDLAGDDVAIELRHLEANAIRRQLHLLDRARCARRMLELRYHRKTGNLTPGEESALSREVARLIDKSPKHSLRFLRILDTPMVVQASVKAGKVTMVDAEKVAKLDSEIQRRIAEEIRAGCEARAVVKKYLPTKPVEVDADRAFERLIGSVERELDGIEGREQEIRCLFPDRTIATLERIAGFARTLIPRLRAQKAASAKAI